MNKIIKLIESIMQDQKKMILTGIFFVVILYVDFMFILSPQFKTISSTGPQISKLKKDIDTLKKEIAQNESLKQQQANTAQGVAKRVVSENQVTSVLQDIAVKAKKYDVRIIQLKPSREGAKSANQNSLFAPFYITLDLSTDYHNLGKFLGDLENGEVLACVNELKMLPDSSNYLKQDVTLVLVTYVKR